MNVGSGGLKHRHEGLGARAKALRDRLGLTLQQVATRGGTTPQTLVQLERNDLASARTLNCVAKALGVTVDELKRRVDQTSHYDRVGRELRSIVDASHVAGPEGLIDLGRRFSELIRATLETA